MAFDWDPNNPAPTTFGLAESGPRTGSPATPEIIVPGQTEVRFAAPTIFGSVYIAERAIGVEPADALDRAEAALRREAAVLKTL